MNRYCMNMEKYIIEKVAWSVGVEMLEYADGELHSLSGIRDFIPMFDNSSIRTFLIEKSNAQRVPVIHRDSFGVFFVCIKTAVSYIFFEPIRIEELDNVTLHRFKKYYGILSNEEPLKYISFNKLLALTELMSALLLSEKYSDDTLIEINKLTDLNERKVQKELILFDLQKDEDERYHHTYNAERILLDCVREGETDKAVQHANALDEQLGQLSVQKVNHYRNGAIVGITLCTRAAIAGGLPPVTVYRISDFYIQKIDACREISDVINYRNQAIAEFSNRIKHKNEFIHTSNHIEQCKSYIAKNYRRKIYLEDIAVSANLSEGYMSRLFKKETGMTFQEYLSSFRVDRAANLLMYSEETIARIGEYVNFPSQSYFCKMFKKYKGMTPKQFRNLYKPSEFIEEK